MAARSTGKCAGRQPAMTALMEIFSTVARPKPGSITMSTSWGWRLVPLNICSTAAGVGGMTGRPSLQSRSARKRFTASSPAGVGLRIHHGADEARLLACGGMGDGNKGRAGLAPALHTGLPRPHKVAGDDADSRNTSFLRGDHVMGKPR